MSELQPEDPELGALLDKLLSARMAKERELRFDTEKFVEVDVIDWLYRWANAIKDVEHDPRIRSAWAMSVMKMHQSLAHTMLLAVELGREGQLTKKQALNKLAASMEIFIDQSGRIAGYGEIMPDPELN